MHALARRPRSRQSVIWMYRACRRVWVCAFIRIALAIVAFAPDVTMQYPRCTVRVSVCALAHFVTNSVSVQASRGTLVSLQWRRADCSASYAFDAVIS